MINKIKISNYKSLHDMQIEPGRLNVIIGENGCGKSNFLEAVTLAGAAISDKLDNEFLSNRGIRVTSPLLMRSNFSESNSSDPIEISITRNEEPEITLKLSNDNKPYSSWTSEVIDSQLEGFKDDIQAALQTAFLNYMTDSYNERIKIKADEKNGILPPENKLKDFKDYYQPVLNKISKDIELQSFVFENNLIKFKTKKTKNHELSNFIIYSPENSSLRNFHEEGQIEPLGTNGKGLLKLIHILSTTEPDAYQDIIESLKLFSWFQDFKIPEDFNKNNDNLTISDKFTRLDIDQRSANEGFLFVLFYISILVSSDTPKVFAIDNIDTALNPKLCIALIKRMNTLAIKYNKQLFVTTHNPAVLDGLDLNDDLQRLFVFKRNRKGQTTVNRITAEKRPKSSTTDDYLNLSESMMRGYLKSLPTNF